LNTAYIIDIIRTPIGKYGGSLSMVRPDDLAAHVIRQLVERNSWMDLNLIEDVIFGDANQAGEDNRNVARMASLMAGLPVETGGVTVNRLCASGLQSIMDVSRAVMLGEGSIYIAGGVESMSRAPYVMGKPEYAFSRKVQTFDSTIGWRFTNPKLADQYYPYSMGETAENVAEKWKISRQQQDDFAFNSQSRYQKAHQQGKFQAEIVPVHIPQKKGDALVFDKDEHPRLSSVEILGSLKPAFKKNGSVTAGNSSGINDGAAASLVVNEEIVKQQIIGHFGLGFYSSFMVADNVEINTLSFEKKAEPAHWNCDGSTKFEITKAVKKELGTEVILHINDDSKEFLNEFRLKGILDKYCKFLPVPNYRTGTRWQG